MIKAFYSFAAASLIFLSSIATAQSDLPNTVDELRVELDRINFTLKDKEHLERTEVMMEHSTKLAEQNPDDAGFQMIAGFYNAQFAQGKGGLGALKYAKAARDLLEKSAKLDPSLHGSSAHAVLGTLYRAVPGWPVGFGDKKKAIKNYKKAVEISPNSIDSTFTYAQYLYSEKKYAEAKIYFEKAKAAPARPLRPKADEFVYEAIEVALAEIAKQI